MKIMIVGGLALAAILGATPTARAAEWCARYDAYTRNCGFHTFRQCLATVQGAGGICERNPRAAFRDRDYYRHRW